jgi:hypothetical protein
MERKPGLYPGNFDIAACAEGDVQVVEVEKCFHKVYLDESRPQISVPVSSMEVAQSVVNDYVQAQLAVIAGEAQPGLFAVAGKYDKLTAAHTLKAQIAVAHEQQKEWFMRLVKIADDDWQRYGQHKFISDTQRYAGKALGLERPWLLARQVEQALSVCPACHAQVHPQAIVCSHCRFVIDKAEYKKMQFAVVE